MSMDGGKKLLIGHQESELQSLLDKYRSKIGDFDCVVPVSGGKMDLTFHTCLKINME